MIDFNPSLPRGKMLVLLADDLRLEDNLAYAIASESTHNGVAVVRFAPEARGRPNRNPNRGALEQAAELRLHRQFSDLNIPFEVIGFGEDLSLLAICRRLECTSVFRNAAEPVGYILWGPGA
jgi:deoxyribodipyrimidine photolyase